MTKQIDILYMDQGLFTAFIPVSKEGEKLWSELAAQTEGTGKVFTAHAKSVISEMRQAGYTVNKAPKQKKLTESELDDMLAELS